MNANSVSAGASSSVLSGTASVLFGGEWLATTWEDFLAMSIEAQRQTMVEDLRQSAQYDPRWAPYADKLDVVFSDGEFHYTVDESVQAEVEALEYGDENTLPTALIMKAARRSSESADLNMDGGNVFG